MTLSYLPGLMKLVETNSLGLFLIEESSMYAIPIQGSGKTSFILGSFAKRFLLSQSKSKQNICHTEPWNPMFSIMLLAVNLKFH